MDYHFIAFYRFYQHPLIRVWRLGIIIGLSVGIIFNYLDAGYPSLLLGLLHIFVMVEIFYRYKICRIQTKKTIKDVEEKEALQVMTLPALSSLHASASAYGVIKDLLHYPHVQFFLERMAITSQDISNVELGNAVLPQEAFQIATSSDGIRITTVDLLAAYLLLTEDKTKLLFTHKLKKEDVGEIVRWTRLVFPYEEEQRVFHVDGNGGGIGESLVIGWTPVTKNYTRNFTYNLPEKDVSIIGYEKEYENIKQALSKSESNNVVIVGEPGVGKEQLIQKLALDSYSGRINSELRYKTILEIMVGSLLAGATNQGELQSRIESIIAEVSHSKNIILYISDFQNILGGGTFSLDLSGVLAPYLRAGSLPIIATMTEGAYKTYLEKSSLNELFSPVKLSEADVSTVRLMVMEKISEVEKKAPIIITYLALVQAVKLADRYTQSMALPGSAIALLSDAVSSILLTESPQYGKSKKRLLGDMAITAVVEQKTKIILSEPTEQEKKLLLHLEDVLHQHIIGQDLAIHTISEAIRRLRTGVESRERPISFLFLGPTGVGKTETAKTLANSYFGGEASMIRLDMSEYADEDGQKRLLGSLPGQGDERGELTEQVRDHPYSLILLDEFEKAHGSIHDLFLQILDDGRLTDNKGNTISFINTIIIATSNAGAEFIHAEIKKKGEVDKQFSNDLLEYLRSQHVFKPELLNRFDAIVTFKPLSQDEVVKITELLLEDLKMQLKEKDITLEIDNGAALKVSRESYDKEMGARPIRRYIQDTLEDLLSQKLLSSEIQRGSSVRLSLDPAGNFVII